MSKDNTEELIIKPVFETPNMMYNLNIAWWGSGSYDFKLKNEARYDRLHKMSKNKDKK